MKYIAKRCLFLSLILTLLLSSSSYALVPGDYSRQEIFFFDPTDICLIGGADPGVLVGTDNVDKSIRYLMSRNLNLKQTSSIVGSLFIASGVNPSLISGSPTPATNTYTPIEGTGFGIGQWSTKESQDALVQLSTDKSLDINSLELQLEYLWSDIGPSGSNLVANIKSASSVEEASLAFYSSYISPDINDNETLKTNLSTEVDSLIAEFTARLANNRPTCNSGKSGFVDGFTTYNQYDPRWKDLPYGPKSTIGASGCGPAAMAMIITALTKQVVTPVDTATYGAAHGTKAKSGSYGHLLGPVIGGYWGLKSKYLAKDVNQINEGVRAGGLVIFSGKGPAPFTSSGHFIVVRAVTSSGKWLIGDSNGKKGQSNSTKEWDPAALLPYMRTNVTLLTLGAG